MTDRSRHSLGVDPSVADRIGSTTDNATNMAAFIANHVGKPPSSCAFAWVSREDAENGVSQVIRERAFKTQEWASQASQGAKKAFELSETSIRGISVDRGGTVSDVHDVRVVLEGIFAV